MNIMILIRWKQFFEYFGKNEHKYRSQSGRVKQIYKKEASVGFKARNKQWRRK